MQPRAMSWYYAEGDSQIGPLERADFDARVQEGKVTAARKVWQEGMQDWAPYGSLIVGPALAVAAVG